MPKWIKIFSVVAVALTLTACSREPNQEELHALYNEKVQSTNALASKIMQQQSNVIQVKSFEKIDCNKVANTKDYSCRFKATVSLPFLGEQTNTAELQVTKGDNGWVILD